MKDIYDLGDMGNLIRRDWGIKRTDMELEEVLCGKMRAFGKVHDLKMGSWDVRNPETNATYLNDAIADATLWHTDGHPGQVPWIGCWSNHSPTQLLPIVEGEEVDRLGYATRATGDRARNHPEQMVPLEPNHLYVWDNSKFVHRMDPDGIPRDRWFFRCTIMSLPYLEARIFSPLNPGTNVSTME